LLMPIYEYQALNADNACDYCRHGFEVFQQIKEKPLMKCHYCEQPVKKIISWCRSAVMEKSEEHTSVENKIKAYEKSGMWSHAAELADKHSEKIKDNDLKIRALENYKKAGYNADSLSKHAKLNDE
jgi:putative FmdB family regulatory protein